MAIVNRKKAKLEKKPGVVKPAIGLPTGSDEYAAYAPKLGVKVLANANQNPPNVANTTAGNVFPRKNSSKPPSVISIAPQP